MSTHTYTNLSRLFLRLFVGVLILQLGIEQMVEFENFSTMSSVMGMEAETAKGVLIGVEFVCSTLFILGLFTRAAIIPLLAIMVYAVNLILSQMPSIGNEVFGMRPVIMPMMFIGVYVYFFIAGPGKISFDYVLARYIISFEAGSEEEEKTLDEA